MRLPPPLPKIITAEVRKSNNTESKGKRHGLYVVCVCVYRSTVLVLGRLNGMYPPLCMGACGLSSGGRQKPKIKSFESAKSSILLVEPFGFRLWCS